MTRPELIDELTIIRDHMLANGLKQASILDHIAPNYRASFLNLIHYLTLRLYPLRDIQAATSARGLSSFTHSEKYTLSNVENILRWLTMEETGSTNIPTVNLPAEVPDYAESQAILQAHTNRLFRMPQDSGNCIMVTLPSEAANDYEIVEDLLEAGMNVARINCSHDNRTAWLKMVDHVKRARETKSKPCSIYMDIAGPKIRTGPIAPPKDHKGKSKKSKKKAKKKYKEPFIELHQGDILHLYRTKVFGRSANYNKDHILAEPAQISVTLPEVFDHINPGETVWFDDGKIGSKILSVYPDHAALQITHGNPQGIRLKAEKGINLPESNLDLPSLTRKDLEDLPFMLEHADIIGYSFVRTPEDVDLLLKHASLHPELGIVLKIENKSAFSNLPHLLVSAMKHPNIGIMIARGDLAIEVGWERIAEVQEEILWLCEAAHVPTIWATQVLEKLAKEGVASRSEITDAAMAGRSECVMLNKGVYILEAVQTLKDILHRMKFHQKKKKNVLRPLSIAASYFNFNN